VTEPTRTYPLRVLFLCTGNSARSQMAEAILNRKGGGRFEAQSAGSHPVERIHPLAIRALREAGIEWRGHPSRSVAGLEREPWDAVITLCERARETCPMFVGQPILAHWGVPDPAAVLGGEKVRRAAFIEALQLISRRIDLMLVLPIEKLERLALATRMRSIGDVEVSVAGAVFGRTAP
jgi:arsenate reductase (thioredoxin)